jgi:hypothetical protein
VSAFKPKRIKVPADEEAPRPSSAEIAATIGPLTNRLIPTSAIPPAPAIQAPPPKVEPSLMMSFKASKPFAKMLAEAAEPEGGLRRLIARVFKEAGYLVPQVDLVNQKKRRTYD